MKKISYIIALLSMVQFYGQDNNRITLGAHIPPQVETIPDGAKRLLINKLGKMITDNGISDNVKDSRFILVPNVSVLGKNITPTAPPKIALSLEITLYVGDGVAGNLFTSETFTAKGVGTNELKAYTNAISSLDTKNPKVASLINKAKTEILEYYENQCSQITQKVASFEAQGQYGKALFTLTSIPESTTCFQRNDQKIRTLYKKAIDEDCSRKFNEAEAIWAANQNIEAANAAGFLLSTIEPESSCFKNAERLYNKIAPRVKELSDRGWEYELQVLDLTKDRIQAARDVGVAFGENQPQNVTYNTRGWF